MGMAITVHLTCGNPIEGCKLVRENGGGGEREGQVDVTMKANCGRLLDGGVVAGTSGRNWWRAATW